MAYTNPFGIPMRPPHMSSGTVREIVRELEQLCRMPVRDVSLDQHRGAHVFHMGDGSALYIYEGEDIRGKIQDFAYRKQREIMNCYANSGTACVPNFTTPPPPKQLHKCASCKEENLPQKHVLDRRGECEKTRHEFGIKVKKLHQYRKSKKSYE